MRPFVIYHGNCADGFGAAWVLWKYFKGNADFYPGVYQRRPPPVKNRFVIFVDFSYKRDVLTQMANDASAILVLDHHKTAMKDLEPDPMHDFFGVRPGACWEEFRSELHEFGDDRGVYTSFDMNRSGAGMTWDFFNPGKPRPKLINHIEDRDLWRFLLPKTREIQASMFSLPYVFETWDDRFNRFDELLPEIVAEGAAIERKHFKDIEELCAVTTRAMKFRVPKRIEFEQQTGDAFEYVTVPVANLPYTMAADAGHYLVGCDLTGHVDPVTHHPFAGCYFDKPDGRQFSLRSHDGGADVGAIAKLYGGGGHEHASGFLVPHDQLGQFEP